MKFLIVQLTILLFMAPHWTMQTSGVNARLRGVSAVSAGVAWASGSGSTVLRTDDGGATWKKLTVTSEALDFRDIDAIDENTAYVLEHRQRRSIADLQDRRWWRELDASVSQRRS